MDIGMNAEFKVKPTPKDDRVVYNQNLLMPVHLKENLLFELPLMHKYKIITVLPFSKYASPIFAQRKPSGKLRFLVDLRKIDTLIADDYNNNNHPVSTLSDTVQHLAGKPLFCKLDCSQADQCLHMVDQRSVEKLAFKFASRTFAYKRLEQGLRDLCLLFWVSCANIWTQLSKLTNVLRMWTILELQPIMQRILPATFEQSSSAFAKQGWNWQSKNATFESDKLNSQAEAFHPRGMATISQNSKLLKQIEMLQIRKGFAAVSGVRKFLQKFYSQDGWKTQPILQTPRSRSPNQHHFRIERKFWFSKQSTEWCLRTSIETTHSCEKAGPAGGCKLQKRWLCPYDWR